MGSVLFFNFYAYFCFLNNFNIFAMKKTDTLRNVQEFCHGMDAFRKEVSQQSEVEAVVKNDYFELPYFRMGSGNRVVFDILSKKYRYEQPCGHCLGKLLGYFDKETIMSIERAIIERDKEEMNAKCHFVSCLFPDGGPTSPINGEEEAVLAEIERLFPYETGRPIEKIYKYLET